MQTPRTILVADQHDLVCRGLKDLFENDDQFRVVASANTGVEVLEYLESNSVDIVMLDVSLPEKDGIDTTREVSEKYPDQILVAHSMLGEIEYINSMLIEGCKGYILKGADRDELTEAFNTVLSGRQYLSPAAREAVDEGYLYTDKRMGGDYVGLKAREREVIICIAKEMTNKEISEKLFISVETVRSHRKNLMTKLNVKTSAGLIKYAVDRCWV